MNRLPGNWSCRVGVQFDRHGVGLAVRRRGRSFIYRALSDDEDRARALSALVTQEGVAGARCVVSLPVGCCQVRWVPLVGVRMRDLRVALRGSTFWQARMGVTRDSHCLWWQLVRDADSSGINALLVAAPRGEVQACTDTIRAAGLAMSRVGLSCFDYLGSGITFSACEVTLVLDCRDAYVLGSGAFGIRVNAVEFDEAGAAALLSTDSRTRSDVVDNLATCVRRCVDEDQSAARVHASVRIITSRALQGEWLEVLRERLPGLQIEWIDGWAAVEVSEPDGQSPGDPWRLPRAMAALDYDMWRSGYFTQRRFLPRVNLAERVDSSRRMRRYLMIIAPAGAFLSLALVLYMRWFLHEGGLALQPDAQRYSHFQQLHEKTLGEVRFLQETLSHRILFYSGIQRISFERKRMPRLLASIEKATLGEVWLDEIHFKRPGFMRITGKSPGDVQISRFMSRLRATGEVDEVLLESAAMESVQNMEPDTLRQLKGFAVICRLRSVQREI